MIFSNTLNIREPTEEPLSFATSFCFSVFLLVVILYELVDLSTDLPAENEISGILGPTRHCEQVLSRQEWRTLTLGEKADYIRAVRCTQRLPNITSYKGVQSRFDDFQAVHIHTADSIHFVGHFLPWHRGFVSQYEKTLREECGYRGAMPYWDWTQDVSGNKSIRLSPILDPLTGFGGDGVNGTYTLPAHLPESSEINTSSFVGCVLDGPFAYNATENGEENGFMLHLGPGKLVTTHCLVRGIDERYANYLSDEVVQHALVQPTYETFRTALEGVLEDEIERDMETSAWKRDSGKVKESDAGQNDFQPSGHDSGHLAIGGELGNLYSSPGDPLFFLHHANLDRIWWIWQSMDMERRLLDISGNVRPGSPSDMDDDSDYSEWGPDDVADPSDMEGEDEEEYDGIDLGAAANSNIVALDFGLKYGPLGQTVSIRELMDINQFPLCYRYL